MKSEIKPWYLRDPESVRAMLAVVRGEIDDLFHALASDKDTLVDRTRLTLAGDALSAIEGLIEEWQ